MFSNKVLLLIICMVVAAYPVVDTVFVSGGLTNESINLTMWLICGLVCGFLFCWGIFYHKV